MTINDHPSRGSSSDGFPNLDWRRKWAALNRCSHCGRPPLCGWQASGTANIDPPIGPYCSSACLEVLDSDRYRNTSIPNVSYAYIAGPLFSQPEREFVERIAKLCERLSIRTFLPHRDGGLQEHGNADDVFWSDLASLTDADIVLANLDGCDVDAGTAWEIGYAVAQHKPVLGVRTDRRVLEPWSAVNLMIERSVWIVSSLDAMANVLLSISRK